MNEASMIVQLGQTFGAPGLFIGFLIWDRIQMRAERKEVEDRRETQADKRLEADKAQTVALTALTTTIQSLPRS